MKQNTVVRKLEFDAGHRVYKHESKCATLHGHRYVVEIHAQGKLDDIGRVVDFSVIKEKVGFWIDLKWDHNTILYEKDTDTIRALQAIPRKKEPYILSKNPTAENMANYLLHDICPPLLKEFNIKVVKVVIYETPNCHAVAEL